MEFNKDTLDSLRKVAAEWPQGVVVIRPFNGEIVVLAVDIINPYDPSNNIHHTTVTGKDISLLIAQRLSIAGRGSTIPIPTYINEIMEVQTWEFSHNESWYWLKIQTISDGRRRNIPFG
jgi:hypothetical protein